MSLTPTQIDTINSLLAALQGPPGTNGTNGTNGRNGTSTFYSFSDDFGADPTGVNPCDSAFAKVIAAGVKRLYIPGTYRFNNPIPLTSQLEIQGDGLTESGFQSYTTLGDGMLLGGPSAIYRLRDFTLEYKGRGQPAGKHGLRAMRKVYADSIQVKGFTNDGIYTDSIDGSVNGSAFYSRWDNVWSKGHGRDGFNQRFGANCHSHNNCQYDKNKRYGFNHNTDGAATYNTTILNSQSCYNGQVGWNFLSGTSIDATNLYAEFNGTPTNSNTDGYTNTPLDFDINAACNHSTIRIGALFSNKVEHVRAPVKGLNDAVMVLWGGMRLFTSSTGVTTAVKLPTG